MRFPCVAFSLFAALVFAFGGATHAEVVRLGAPISDWEHGIPLGNGLTGGMLWGSGNRVVLSLDRGDLWDLRLPPTLQRPDWTYATLKRLVRDGAEAQLHALFDDPYDDDPMPTKLNAGRIELTFPANDDVARSRLDLDAAEASTALTRGTVTAFFSAVQPVAMLQIAGPQPQVTIGAPSGIAKLGYVAPVRGTSARDGVQTQWLRQNAALGLQWAIVASERRVGDDDDVAITIVSNREASDPVTLGTQRTRDALARGYDALSVPHRARWHRFWSISSVDVPDAAVQQQYDLDKYLYGSASRRGDPPMPLQGVWTADNGGLPPWKGDYHNDLNTEMTYLAYADAGLFDQGASFFDFNTSLLPAYERFARTFYGVDGALVPGVESLDGQALGGWAQYSLSPTMSAWIAWMYWRHWRYTMDASFLRTQAYPFASRVGVALEALLRPDPDGKLQLPLSSSPEIFDDSMRAWLPPNSNFDLAMLRALYRSLAQMARAQGFTADASRWNGTLARLAPYDVHDGALTIARGIPLPYSHRHFSNDVAIYPLELLSADDLAERALVQRSIDDTLSKGTSAWTGYSFAWMACMLAYANRGDEALTYLHEYLRGFVYPNGLHVNGDQSGTHLSDNTSHAFTLEGNFLAMQAVHEMLLRSRSGLVQVFPAVPHAWRDASFQHLRGQGGVIVSAVRRNGETERIAVRATVPTELRLRDPFPPGVAVVWNRPVRRAAAIVTASLRAGQWLIGDTQSAGGRLTILDPRPGTTRSGLIDIRVHAPAGTTAVYYAIDGMHISEETNLYARMTHTKPIWMTATSARWLPSGAHTLRVVAVTPTGTVASSVRFTSKRTAVTPSVIPLDGAWQFASADDAVANRWTTVLVPDAFDALDTRWNVYDGMLGEYRKRVVLPAARSGERTWLVLESCGWQCTVRVNGTRVGVTSGGYLPARFDVTRALRNGANDITIDADNRVATIGDLSGFMVDYWNWGGIFQSVYLQRTPAVALTAVRASGTQTGTLTLFPEGVNATSSLRIVRMRISVFDPKGARVLGPLIAATTLRPNEPDGTTIALRLSHPHLWSLDHPMLYTVRVATLASSSPQTFAEQTGFRTVSVRGSDLYLNGRIVHDLQGFNRHADYPGLGRTQPAQLADREIKRLHDKGFRIFRPAHYPTTPAELRAADTYGLLVIEEINVTGEDAASLRDPRVHRFARDRLRAMIDRDRSHPSIIAWSVGNENATDTRAGAAYVRDTIAYGRSLDPARLFTEVSNRGTSDEAYPYEDFVATNFYAGWYGGPVDTTLADGITAIQRASGGKPLLISEYGAEAVHGRAGFGRGTEFYQAHLIDDYNRVLAHRPHFIGKMYWLASEFIVSPTWSGGNPDPVPPFHTKALLTYYRQAKLGWRVMFSPVRIDDTTFSPDGVGYSARITVRDVRGKGAHGMLVVDAPHGFRALRQHIPFVVPPNGAATYAVKLLPTTEARQHAAAGATDGIVRAVVNSESEAAPLRIVLSSGAP